MTAAIVPGLILAVIVLSLIGRVPVFDAFTEGAADALPLLKRILPCMAAMLIAIRVFRDSGALDFLIRLLSPLMEPLGADARLLPLMLLRPLSGSAAVAAATDLMQTYGADSRVGYTAAVLVGASETVFYTVALYFGAIGIRRTRWTVPAALGCTLVAMATGILFSNLFYR